MQRRSKPPRNPKVRKTDRNTTKTCNGKVRYRDKQEADAAVKRIGNRSERRSLPQRSYSCYDCHGWHLSSRPDHFGQV